MTLRLGNSTLDCANPRRVASFWSEALGRPIDEGGSEFFLVYGRGQVIDHDSKMGVESAAFWTLVNRANQPPPLSWNPVLYALGVAAIAGLVAATVVLSRRRRREN